MSKPCECKSNDQIREMVRSGYAAIATGERSCCCSSQRNGQPDPLYRQIAETLPKGEEMADYVVSLSIAAQK